MRPSQPASEHRSFGTAAPFPFQHCANLPMWRISQPMGSLAQSENDILKRQRYNERKLEICPGWGQESFSAGPELAVGLSDDEDIACGSNREAQASAKS